MENYLRRLQDLEAIANSFEQYRQAGAAVRAMLVAAAAKQWNVPPESIQVKNGVVFHANGKKATFGELATAAAKEPIVTVSLHPLCAA